MTAADIGRALRRIGHEIVERHPSLTDLVVVGIHTRGAHMAERIGSLIAEFSGSAVPVGHLDIGQHRDDSSIRPVRSQRPTTVPVPIDDLSVIVVDDVLYTGRTVRAAIDALFDYGRPARVQLAVLVDRGHRELPIRPDYVGKNLPTAPGERVNVRLEEIDGSDEVAIQAAAAKAGTRGGSADARVRASATRDESEEPPVSSEGNR
jgi:pyrimidine operon attenuation protein/uracil phosphoribosyltransferase